MSEDPKNVVRGLTQAFGDLHASLVAAERILMANGQASTQQALTIATEGFAFALDKVVTSLESIAEKRPA